MTEVKVLVCPTCSFESSATIRCYIRAEDMVTVCPRFELPHPTLTLRGGGVQWGTW